MECLVDPDTSLDQQIMNLIDTILTDSDDDFFEEEEESETNQSTTKPPHIKRKRQELEEGEIDEVLQAVCTGFFFDTSIMKKVSGCVDCHHGHFCRRPRRA